MGTTDTHNRRALITGITGQDGSYLAEYLLELGYEVFGLIRPSPRDIPEYALPLVGPVELLSGDMTDYHTLVKAIEHSQPHEIYNLAALSYVGSSFESPFAVMETNGLGVLRLLEAIRETKSTARLYQASTSEMVGQSGELSFQPKSPYACSKLYAHWSVINYREAHHIWACCGIMYNHESPRRGKEFVTRKITRGVARIASGIQERLVLGNLDAYRDWGYAPDYIRAMQKMLQLDTPQDLVIATGHSHSVAEFVRKCFEYVGIKNWQSYTEISAALYRPQEVDILVGHAQEARDLLMWSPQMSFDGLIVEMMEHDLQEARDAIAARKHGTRGSAGGDPAAAARERGSEEEASQAISDDGFVVGTPEI